MSFAKAQLLGNLTRDPETRYSGSGMALVNFGLATTERFTGADGNPSERTTFVDVTMFGKRGEAFARFHSKGSQAYIDGKLRLDSWEDKKGGGKRSKLYVVADSWEFVGSKGGGRASSQPQSGNDGGGDGWGDTEEAPF